MSIEPNEFTADPTWHDRPIIERLESELIDLMVLATNVEVSVGNHPIYGYVLIVKDRNTGFALAEKVAFI